MKLKEELFFLFPFISLSKYKAESSRKKSRKCHFGEQNSKAETGIFRAESGQH